MHRHKQCVAWDSKITSGPVSGTSQRKVRKSVCPALHALLAANPCALAPKDGAVSELSGHDTTSHWNARSAACAGAAFPM